MREDPLRVFTASRARSATIFTNSNANEITVRANPSAAERLLAALQMTGDYTERGFPLRRIYSIYIYPFRFANANRGRCTSRSRITNLHRALRGKRNEA